MAKIEKLVEQAQTHLQSGEVIQEAVMGSYEAKLMGSDTVRAGVMLATDRRIVFYAKKLGGFDLESFPYGSISSFEQSKSMMGHQIKFFASGNTINLKWINDAEALAAFVKILRHQQAAPVAPAPNLEAAIIRTSAPSAPTPSSSDVVFDQLRQLGQLRDAGIVTPEEFEAKKTELLARL